MNIQYLKRIPGYQYNEYILILKPNKDLLDKIIGVKNEFNDKYKITKAIHSQPQITLVNFIQFGMMEERLVNRLKIIAMGYHAFTVELKNFGSFPSHTIYINIASQLQIQNLEKVLRQAQQLMTINKDNKPHFINNPNLAIARKLLPWQFEKGWLEYSQRHFTGRFIADSMVLLKRPLEALPGGQHTTGKYSVVQRFEFQNLPVNTRQGELFV